MGKEVHTPHDESRLHNERATLRSTVLTNNGRMDEHPFNTYTNAPRQ